MADENITIGVDLKDDFTAPARRVVKSLDDIGDEATSASARFKLVDESIEGTTRSATAAQGRIRGLTRRVKDLGRESIKSAAAIKILDAAASRLGRFGGGGGGRHAKAKVPGGGSPGGGMMIAGGIGGMPITMALGVMTIIAGLIPVISTALSALAAAAMGAVGALSPIVGVIVPATGALLGMGLALGSVIIAMRGFGEALKTLRDPTKSIQEVRAALKDFNTVGGKNPANQLVRDFSRLGTKLNDVKATLLRALIPSFRVMAKSIDGLLPMFSRNLRLAAVEVAGLTRQFSSFLNTAAGRNQMDTILRASATSLSGLGQAAFNAFRVVLDLLEAASPIINKMTSDIGNFFQKISSSTGRNKNELEQFFERSYVVLEKTVKITGDLLKALYNIGKIGVPLGSAMGDTFLDMAERFREFTESAEGIQKIRQWFIDMTPVVYELGRLLLDIIDIFVSVGQDKSFLELASLIRSEVIPIIKEFIQNATRELLPALLSIAVAALAVFNELSLFTFIVPIFQGIAAVLGVVAKILGMFEGAVGLVIGAFVAMLFTVKMLTTGLLLLRQAKLRTVMAARTLTTSMPALAGALGLASGAAITTRAALMALFRAAGPIGLALMAIGFLTEAILSNNDAIEESIETNNDWARALFDVNGALQDNYKQQIAQKAASDGLFDLMDKVGLKSYGKMIEAISGNKDAATELLFELENLARPGVNRYGEVEMSDSAQAAQELINRIRALSGEFVESSRQAGQVKTALSEIDRAAERTARATENLNRALQRLKGLLSARASSRQYLEDLAALRKSLEDNGTSFDKFTEEGRANLSAIDAVYETTLERVNDALERGNTNKAIALMEKTKKDLAKIAGEVPAEARKGIRNQIKLLNNDLNDAVRAAAKIAEPKVKVTPVLTGAELKQAMERVTPPTIKPKMDGAALKQLMESMPPALTDPKVKINVSGTVDIKNIDVITSTTQGLVDNLMIVGSRHDPKISATQITNAKTQADLLEDKLIQLTGKTWTVVVNYKENKRRANGGPVMSGINYTVGELGPEAFIGKSGNVTMIGLHGQQQKTFNEDGWVVPNSQLASAMAGLADSGPQRSEYEIGGSGPVINIGTINASNEIDVIKAVKKGIAEAERNRRERS